jgi:hypothetical protein
MSSIFDKIFQRQDPGGSGTEGHDTTENAGYQSGWDRAFSNIFKHPAHGEESSYSTSTPTGAKMGNNSGGSDKGKNSNTKVADYQTQANRINQNTPFGSTNFSQDANGQWSQQTGLAPGMQGAYDNATKQMQDAWSKPMDDGSGARDQAINAAYGQSVSRLNPQWDQRQNSMQAQLANQGLDPHSEAFRTSSEQFGRDRNDAYSSAMNNAVGLGNQAQQAAWQQQYQARMAPLQQLQGMKGLLSMPGYNSSDDYLKAAQLDQANQAAWINGGAQVVGAVAGGAASSDERLKTNVQRLPVDAIPGVPMALFEYRSMPGKQHVGVIAQDLEKVAPEHVGQDERGFKTVSAPFAPFSFGRSK